MINLICEAWQTLSFMQFVIYLLVIANIVLWGLAAIIFFLAITVGPILAFFKELSDKYHGRY